MTQILTFVSSILTQNTRQKMYLDKRYTIHFVSEIHPKELRTQRCDQGQHEPCALYQQYFMQPYSHLKYYINLWSVDFSDIALNYRPTRRFLHKNVDTDRTQKDTMLRRFLLARSAVFKLLKERIARIVAVPLPPGYKLLFLILFLNTYTRSALPIIVIV